MDIYKLNQEILKQTRQFDSAKTDETIFRQKEQFINKLKTITNIIATFDKYDFEKQAHTAWVVYTLINLLYTKNVPIKFKLGDTEKEKNEILIVKYLTDDVPNIESYSIHSFSAFVTNNELVKKNNKETNLLIKIINGLYVDPYKDIIFVNSYLIRKSRSTSKSMANIITLLNKSIVEQVDDDILDELETTYFNSEKTIYETIVKDSLRELSFLQVFILGNVVKNTTIRSLTERQKTLRTEFEKYEKLFNTTYENYIEISNKLTNSENIDTSKITETVKKMIENGLINHLEIVDTTPARIKIYWNALPITYYNEDNLEKSYKNIIGSGNERIEVIEKVIKGEAQLYTLPLTTEINLSNNGQFNFATRTNGYASSNYYNQHPLHNGGTGCRGGFAIPMGKAISECDLNKLIHLILQFYQSITINDPLGNNAIKYMTVVNEEGIAISGTYKGKSIEYLNTL